MIDMMQEDERRSSQIDENSLKRFNVPVPVIIVTPAPVLTKRPAPRTEQNGTESSRASDSGQEQPPSNQLENGKFDLLNVHLSIHYIHTRRTRGSADQIRLIS